MAEKIPGTEDLDPRLQRFCLEYAKTGNGYLSARVAGFPDQTARDLKRRIMSKPGVLDEIRRLNRILERDTIASIEEIQSRLTRVIRKQDDTKDAEFVPEDYWFKTVDLLNRMKGAYIERQQLEITNDSIVRVEHTVVEKSITPIPEPQDLAVEPGNW